MSKCDVSVPAHAVSTVVRLAQTAALLAEISTGFISKQSRSLKCRREGGRVGRSLELRVWYQVEEHFQGGSCRATLVQQF